LHKRKFQQKCLKYILDTEIQSPKYSAIPDMMMVHDDAEFAMHRFEFSFRSINQFLQFYQDIQFYRRASRRSRQGWTRPLSLWWSTVTEHSLVRRTVSGVYQLCVERIVQQEHDDSNIADLQNHGHQHIRAWSRVRADATLHEDRADAGHESTKSAIPQHLAVAHPLDHLPIGTHIFHALAYFAATQYQETVICTAH